MSTSERNSIKVLGNDVSKLIESSYSIRSIDEIINLLITFLLTDTTTTNITIIFNTELNKLCIESNGINGYDISHIKSIKELQMIQYLCKHFTIKIHSLSYSFIYNFHKDQMELDKFSDTYGIKLSLHNIFYSLPVRQQNINKNYKEKVIKLIRSKAMMYYSIKFQVFMDNKLHFQVIPQVSFKKMIEFLYGKAIVQQTISINATSIISSLTKAVFYSNNYQLIYLNYTPLKNVPYVDENLLKKMLQNDIYDVLWRYISPQGSAMNQSLSLSPSKKEKNQVLYMRGDGVMLYL